MADPTAEAGPGPGAPGGSDRSADRPPPDDLLERVWYGPRGPASRLLDAVLAPAELAFRGIVALRGLAYDTDILPAHPPPTPALSVGNLTVGGTGKTPMVRWLVERLASHGRTPAIVHGGYAGDEPALLRRWFSSLPVIVDRDRVRGARSAAAAGADIVVLDDAFQHRRIGRDLDIALVAAEAWTAHPRLLPRGPYREPLRALARADLVIVTRRTADVDAATEVARAAERAGGRPCAVAHLRPGPWLSAEGAPRAGRPGDGAVAVAGIGRPDAFFRQVADAGVELAGRLAYRDHHDYTPEDAAAIRARGGPVITTAKDAVKLVSLLGDADVWVMDVEVAFDLGEDVVLERVAAVAS